MCQGVDIEQGFGRDLGKVNGWDDECSIIVVNDIGVFDPGPRQLSVLVPTRTEHGWEDYHFPLFPFTLLVAPDTEVPCPVKEGPRKRTERESCEG